MPITGISHFGICVSDMERSIAFYRDVLGFTFVRRMHVDQNPEVRRLLELDTLDMELAFLEIEGARIELISFRAPEAARPVSSAFNRIGLTHMSLWVTDFDRTVGQVKARGGPVKEHTVGGMESSNSRFCFLTDPDGTRIELFGLLDESRPKPV